MKFCDPVPSLPSLPTVKFCSTYCDQKVGLFRPVGSNYEMVRPYYSAKRAHNVLGHAHLSSPPPPPSPTTRRPGILALWNVTALKLLLKPLSLSPNDSVGAVTLENGALLYAFFIVFAAVTARAYSCAIYCERFPKFTLRRKLSSGDKVCFPPAPTQILWMTAVIRGPF